MRKSNLFIVLFSLVIGICQGQLKHEVTKEEHVETQNKLIKTESVIELDLDLRNASQDKDVRARWVNGVATQKNLPSEAYRAESAVQSDGTLKMGFEFSSALSNVKPALMADYIEIEEVEGTPMKGTPKPLRPYDSRFEIASLTMLDLDNQRIITNSFSVLGMVASSQLLRTTTGFHAQALGSLRQAYGVCPGELYADQPVLCFGTAFLVAPNIIVTAKHNLDVMPVNKMSFLIGYQTLPSGKYNLDFHEKDVYNGMRVIPSEKLDQLDLTLIKLDRKVVGAIPLPIEPDFIAPLAERIYSLGYPVGLPMKYITNASIKSKENDLVYYTTLDTFKGNSGSPVFRKSSHQVIGVLVEGGIDFNYNGNCFVVNVCSGSSCKGEKVVNLSKARNYIMDLIKQFE